MKSSLLLEALEGKNQSRPPVWLMRQAGRYLPQYQAMRRKYSLKELFFTPHLAAEVTSMPVQEFGIDAAILFSDITVIAQSLGLTLDFQEGPVICPLVKTALDVKRLEVLDAADVLAPVGEAVRLCQSKVPLIGFCGGPFTVASYLIENPGKSDLFETKRWLCRDPDSFHLLLDKITQASVRYIQMQVKNGADVIQIFDSWANVLSESQFNEVCIPYWKRLLEAARVPGIVFARGNSFRIESIRDLNCAISVDWQLPMDKLRRKTKLALQGNLDPDLLFAPLEVVKRETMALLDSMRGDRAFIVNLGHGVKPQTPVDAVRCVVDTVRNYGS